MSSKKPKPPLNLANLFSQPLPPIDIDGVMADGCERVRQLKKEPDDGSVSWLLAAMGSHVGMDDRCMDPRCQRCYPGMIRRR